MNLNSSMSLVDMERLQPSHTTSRLLMSSEPPFDLFQKKMKILTDAAGANTRWNVCNVKHL